MKARVFVWHFYLRPIKHARERMFANSVFDSLPWHFHDHQQEKNNYKNQTTRHDRSSQVHV